MEQFRSKLPRLDSIESFSRIRVFDMETMLITHRNEILVKWVVSESVQFIFYEGLLEV